MQLLVALAGIVEDRQFHAADVIEHARLVNPALRGILEATGVRTAKELGPWLHRMESLTVGGFVLERCHRDRAGPVWCVRAVDHDSHTRPPKPGC